MEREEVFRATHELVLRLLREGKVDGLRIDHPDGLFDPRQYLERLQQHFVLACAREVFDSDPAFRGLEWAGLEGHLGELIAQVVRKPPAGAANSAPPADGRLSDAPPLYVVVEKILGPVEPMPEDWPTYGTSGYYFVNMLNGLFVDGRNFQPFTRLYQDWIDSEVPFAEVVYQKKFLIMQVALSSELHMLANQLDRLAQKNRWSRDFTLHSLRHALREVIACFPVYRSYISAEGVHEADRRYVQVAVRRARLRNPAISSSLFDFVRDVLLLQYPGSVGEDYRAGQRHFAGKFQQVTAPVMAKGLEDTAFYVYNRLASLNEVGGAPDRFGVEPAVIHRYLQERQARWPRALSATSTHDTKRSEDVRARINVLSEVPEEWRQGVARWGKLNAPHRTVLDDVPAPDPNEEYLLYQTLLGAWPIDPYGPEEYAAFAGRVQAYMAKALHEAKVHTSWINPDPAYDQAVEQFVARVLDENLSGEFLRDLRTFQRRVSHYGMFNSLAQTLVKMAAPGVPDTYQGTEVWDFSLVDPDNRRPVDYDRRRRMLAELLARSGPGQDRAALARELVGGREDGRVKLYVTVLALHCLRAHPGLFSTGAYFPVEAAGARELHVFAFARHHEGRWAVAAVPRLLTQLVPATEGLPLGNEVWRDTVLRLPDAARGRRWRNVFTGEVLTPSERGGQPVLLAGEVFATFPVALLLAEPLAA
jgi:(1->4)-alpha-D-glucan 1-alpha-D-glucosylmutase